MTGKPIIRVDWPNGGKMIWVDPPARVLDVIEAERRQAPEENVPIQPEPSPLNRFFRSAAFPIFVVIVLAYFAQKLIG